MSVVTTTHALPVDRTPFASDHMYGHFLFLASQPDEGTFITETLQHVRLAY